MVRRDAKNGRARPGYFINISFRCLSLPRCSGGAARQRRRPASGHRYPLLPLHEERAHKAGEKVERARKNPWKRREDEYIYIYIEGRRGGGAASPERGRGALYYIERRNVAAEIVSSPSSHPSPANKDEVSANIILVTGYSPGETTTSLYIHRSLNRSSSLLKLGSIGCLWMDYGICQCVHRGIRGFVEFSFWKCFSTAFTASWIGFAFSI